VEAGDSHQGVSEAGDENKPLICIEKERLASLHQAIDRAQAGMFYAELVKDELSLAEETAENANLRAMLDEVIKQNREVCRLIISFARLNLEAEDWVTILGKKETQERPKGSAEER